MGISKSETPLDERIAQNHEIAAEKKRKKRLEQKRGYYHAAQERKRLAEEQRKSDEKNTEHFASGDWFVHRGLKTIGEISSGVDVRNLNECILVANLWCGILGLTLVSGETILERELRVAEEYCRVGSPWLTSDGELVYASDATPFDPKTWIALPGATTTNAGVPGSDIQSGPPVFVAKLVPKKPKPAEVKTESIPDSTGHSGEVNGTPCMTMQQENELAVRKEFLVECSELQKVQAQIDQKHGVPKALFQSEVGKL
jgi:hypothetical protein